MSYPPSGPPSYGSTPPPPDPDTPSGLSVDAGKLWSGGVATAVVAALAAVVGLLVCRGVLDIAVLVPSGGGGWDVASTVPYAVAAAGAALLATALMHLLLLTTPRPRMFFGWIAVLVAVIIGVLPFTLDAPLEEKIASAAVGVLIVIIIGTLVSGTADRAVRNAPYA